MTATNMCYNFVGLCTGMVKNVVSYFFLKHVSPFYACFLDAYKAFDLDQP